MLKEFIWALWASERFSFLYFGSGLKCFVIGDMDYEDWACLGGDITQE